MSMSTITIKTTVDIDYVDLKDEMFDALIERLDGYYGINWYDLEPESREEILENVLQEFSK